jgi:hypothetical protein
LWPWINTWILRRSLADKPTDEEILRGTSDALAIWFARALPWGVDCSFGGCVRAMVRRRPLELPSALSARLVSPAPTLAGDTFASVRIEFLYLGRARHMPWPVLSAAGRWEPFDCRWALQLVAVPHG